MKEIPLTQGKVALVDDEDFEYLNQFKWYAGEARGLIYARRQLRPKDCNSKIWMHTDIMKTPKGMVVDHKDGDGLNNWRSNLRLVTHRQNLQNISLSKKSSQYPGVSRCPLGKNGKRWQVSINYNGKVRHITRCISEEDAATTYRVACKVLIGVDVI
jgi:hypothetical protein